MITNKSQKQEWERYFISGSIMKVQQTGEVVSLANSSVLAWDNEDTDVSTTLLDQSTKKLDDDPKTCGQSQNNMLSVRVQDGTEDKAPYKVTFRMETNLGNRYEADMRIGVNEI